MTRINLVDPSHLTNRHLVAEYRELPRIFTLVRNAMKSGKCISDYDIPATYVLGTGHVTFFYDKIYFLYIRFCSLVTEMRARGFDTSQEFLRITTHNYRECVRLQAWEFRRYQPTPQEIYLNMSRLVDKWRDGKA